MLCRGCCCFGSHFHQDLYVINIIQLEIAAPHRYSLIFKRKFILTKSVKAEMEYAGAGSGVEFLQNFYLYYSVVNEFWITCFFPPSKENNCKNV